MKRQFLFNSVRSILISDWDPILIRENPKLHDEYDTYAREISNLLISEGFRKENLYEILLNYEEQTIGMCISEERRKDVVMKLISLKE